MVKNVHYQTTRNCNCDQIIHFFKCKLILQMNCLVNLVNYTISLRCYVRKGYDIKVRLSIVILKSNNIEYIFIVTEGDIVSDITILLVRHLLLMR
jgi:hypothetical protein